MTLSPLRLHILALLGLAGAGLIAGCGGDDDDNGVKPGQPPVVQLFTASPADIMPGDSSLLTYKVSGADSVKLLPDNLRLTPPDSSQRWVKPPLPATYYLYSYNKAGSDWDSLSITMSGAAARIDVFAISEDTIVTGDSVIMSWSAVRADSVVLSSWPQMLPLRLDSSGQDTLGPLIDIAYYLRAYSVFGDDRDSLRVRVEDPDSLDAVFGLYYKGVMGGEIVSPEARFRVLDPALRTLRKPWVHFSRLEGDGALAPDSAQPDANGQIFMSYQFSGNDPSAVVRGMVRDVDTVGLKVRASAIVFGADGHGQYLRLNDIYADVKGFNGQPNSVDEDPDFYINYANYESSLGVVAAIADINQNLQADDGELVWEVYLTSLFTEAKTADSIGIGSTIQEVRAAYGTPDTTWYDPAPPPARALRYRSLGALFYCGVSGDSAVIEIHVEHPTGRAPAAASAEAKAPSASTRSTSYRRWQSR